MLEKIQDILATIAMFLIIVLVLVTIYKTIGA